ncbi:hypothetical protein CDD83_5022 [Cordyceps sp. RAO-2017]|nr:hypothetical protein CDD83_5022 [Cordyceps sp. RAO-2017]
MATAAAAAAEQGVRLAGAVLAAGVPTCQDGMYPPRTFGPRAGARISKYLGTWGTYRLGRASTTRRDMGQSATASSLSPFSAIPPASCHGGQQACQDGPLGAWLGLGATLAGGADAGPVASQLKHA